MCALFFVAICTEDLFCLKVGIYKAFFKIHLYVSFAIVYINAGVTSFQHYIIRSIQVI